MPSLFSTSIILEDKKTRVCEIDNSSKQEQDKISQSVFVYNPPPTTHSENIASSFSNVTTGKKKGWKRKSLT